MLHYRTCERCGGAVYAPPSEVALGKGRYCSRACRSGPADERFMRFVHKQPSGCWLWTGRSWTRRNGPEYGGYPKFSWGGRLILAHHAAWLLHIGPLPEGKLIRHRCPGGANRWCVNPDHLQAGDIFENMRDMVEDGRHWAQTGLILPLSPLLRERLEARAHRDGLHLPALIVALLDAAV